MTDLVKFDAPITNTKAEVVKFGRFRNVYIEKRGDLRTGLIIDCDRLGLECSPF